MFPPFIYMLNTALVILSCSFINKFLESKATFLWKQQQNTVHNLKHESDQAILSANNVPTLLEMYIHSPRHSRF